MTFEEVLDKQMRTCLRMIWSGVALIVLGIITIIVTVVSGNALAFIAWAILAAVYLITSPILSARCHRELNAATIEYYN